MEPRTRESYILARGMTEIVRVLLQRMRHTGPRQLYRQQQQLLAGEQELQGFCLYDLSHINKLRASEQEEPGRVVAGHNPAIFAIAMDRMTAGGWLAVLWCVFMCTTGICVTRIVAAVLPMQQWAAVCCMQNMGCQVSTTLATTSQCSRASG